MREITIQVPLGFSNVLNNQLRQAASAAIQSTLIASKAKWEQIAQQKLTTTRADYLLGLNADDSLEFPDMFTGILRLRGKWPNMLEEGFPAFDMKKGFQRSDRAKPKKNGGWYLTIPLRHRTPGTTGSAVGGAAMPMDIYARARALRANTQRLTGTEQQYPPGVSWTGYQHKSGIYEGMVRKERFYDKVAQSHYMTFRRVSDKSDPKSWWHPGFEGVRAVDQVAKFAQDTLERVFIDYVKRYMG